MQQSVLMFKALSDAKRLLMLQLITRQQELCVCELTVALELSQPLVSQLIGKCRRLGLITGRKEGKWLHYSLAADLPPWFIQLMANLPSSSELELAEQRLMQMGNRPERVQKCCA